MGPRRVSTAGTTLNICVAAPDPFGVALDELVAGETVGAATGTRGIQRIECEAQDVDSCHVLFLPSSPGVGSHPFLRKAASLPILTISDDQRFLDEGGIIGMRVVDGRVRFDVDLAAARRVGLRISSQLLRLALTVRGAVS